MSNSKNSNLEDVSKGNDESAPRANDSTSNKKTRFTKSKSISEVFKELDESEQISDLSNDFEDSSADEIIPIHNEYEDLDKSDALADESVEGGIIINPDSDDFAEVNVYESTDVDSVENTDSISGEANFDEFSESIDSAEEFDEEAFFIPNDSDDRAADEDAGAALKDSDDVVADEDIEEKMGKSSAQGVLINDKEKSSDSKRSFDLFNSASIISIVGFIVGFAILLIGITYYASSSDRVVDNVLSGETAGLAIFLVIIGLIILGFSLLNLFSSSKSSFIIDTFNSIKSIDYDDISEDIVSREDFDAVFSIFKRKKDSNFSSDGEKDKSVDSSKDLFEKDEGDELSEDDISSLYSESNLTSQKNQTTSSEHDDANSTEGSQDNYDEDDEIIPIHSNSNEQSSEDSLEDKYSKYDFDDDYEEECVEEYEEEYELVDESLADDGDYALPEDDPSVEEIVEEAYLDDDSSVSNEEYDLVEEPVEDNLSEGTFEEESFEEESFEEESFGEDANSSLGDKKMDGLEDKYAKYDFDEDDEIDEPVVSKPKFKKSVDLSKFEKDALTEEELAEKERKAKELAEKKRRIIEGTNFDNSLRKN